MRTSDRFRMDTDAIWRASATHPFLLGIGDGTLAVDRFQFYVKQDYLFLIEFSRALAVAAAKARSLRLMGELADLLHSTLAVEMDLHRSFCREFGISAEDLAVTPAAPTTRAYTNYLLCAAYGGDSADIMAALLPCVYGYYEHGRDLFAAGLPVSAPLYAKWIEMYASSEYATLAEWLRTAFDAACKGLPAERIGELAEIYRTSVRYEFMFWDMSYRKEEWPV